MGKRKRYPKGSYREKERLKTIKNEKNRPKTKIKILDEQYDKIISKKNKGIPLSNAEEKFEKEYVKRSMKCTAIMMNSLELKEQNGKTKTWLQKLKELFKK